MELIHLPSQLEQYIAGDGLISKHYRIIPPFSDIDKEADNMLSAILSGITAETEKYYHFDKLIHRKEKTPTKINKQAISDVVYEAIKNAFAHGSKNTKSIVYGSFYGTNGIWHAFLDGGEYFKCPEVKEAVESASPIDRSLNGIKRWSGSGYGMGMIYESSDKRYVDNSQNTLFVLQYRQRLLAPSQ